MRLNLKFITTITLMLSLIPLNVQGDAVAAPDQTINSQMISVSNNNFDIKIDPSLANNPKLNITTMLNFAYYTVGSDFQFFPDYKIPVVVSKNQQYIQGTNIPRWATANSYDGTIRLEISPNQSTFKGLQSTV